MTSIKQFKLLYHREAPGNTALLGDDESKNPVKNEGELFEKSERIELKNDTLFFTFLSSDIQSLESNRFV